MKILDINSLKLDDLVFNLEPNDNRDRDILSRVVNWQLARRQTGNHKTKQVGEVSGTTKKMYRQKGTGGARHGSKRATQFRGGGIIFGPVVRDHSFDIPKQVRKLALKIVLSDKRRSGNLIVVDRVGLDSHKTKDAIKTLNGLKLTGQTLFVGDNDLDHNSYDAYISACLALRNTRNYSVMQSIGANVYDILNSDVLVLSQGAVKDLEERLK